MKLTVPGKLPGLNEYITAERQHRQKAAAMKKQYEHMLMLLIKSQMRGVTFTCPVRMRYLWIEKDRRRDKDNISSMGRKIIQDALVRSGVLKNDGWSEIAGFSDDFAVDKQNPRIEITFEEENRGKKR